MTKSKNFYSYEEALASVRSMSIKTKAEYIARYKVDPRLPAAPNDVYLGVGWVNWPAFFGRELVERYATYLEAKRACRKLRIKKRIEYFSRYREDPRLPSNPNSTYAGKGWVNWFEFLGIVKIVKYESYVEAKAAVSDLGVKNRSEYSRRYAEDKRLYAAPHEAYAGIGWVSWEDYIGFFRVKLYPIFEEAKQAVKRLGIRSSKEYFDRYNEDPKLPSNPHIFYQELGWEDWFSFIDIQRTELYSSYAEAQSAAQKLGVLSQPEYVRRYKEDPRLPSNPRSCYVDRGWKGWNAFLGTKKVQNYQKYEQAKAAVQLMGIRSFYEYRKRYSEDEFLPFAPHKTYKNMGWISWPVFLRDEYCADPGSQFPIIWGCVELWLRSQTNLASRRFALKAFLTQFYSIEDLVDDPKYLLNRSSYFNSELYQGFILKQAPSSKRTMHGFIADFYGWVLDEYCTDIDSYEKVVLPGFRNPFETVLSGFSDSLNFYRPNQSTKPPLGYEYILRARKFLVPNSEQVLQRRTSLKDLPHLQEFFRSRIDWMYVDESAIDYTDPNCIWRCVKGADRVIDGKRQQIDSFQIWSPVRFVALYTLLRYPLRGQQILWLDSGEADEEIAVIGPSGQVAWESNSIRLVDSDSKFNRPQAAVQRGGGDLPKMYVTTNKTGRKEGGYEVEWIPDDLVYWFIILRDWQRKYNPLDRPTRWVDISLPAETNEKILRSRGSQCFLFRVGSSGQPMTTSSAFIKVLPTLLYKIQRPGENLAKENPDKTVNRVPHVSCYTPHSLRVSLITAYVADGEAPIHLISKLVGHAALVMTIYYTKLNSGQMRRAMSEAEKKAEKIVSEKCSETISAHGLHPLRRQLISTDGNRMLISSDIQGSACVVFDYGVCPMSAGGCHIGGYSLAERKVESIYAPVEAGYLGQKNCPRCRFFVTGVPFIGGLVALANELALEIHSESARFNKFTMDVDRLEEIFFDSQQIGQPDLHQVQRKQAVANQQQSAAKLDGLLSDYSATHHYVKACLKLIDEGTGEEESGVRLIVAKGFSEIGMRLEESVSGYHLLAEICQDATIYQSVNPSRAVPLISQLIDRMAEGNGIAPAMFRLNDDQKLIVINELNRLLLQRLGSWEKIDELVSGNLMLLDIDSCNPSLIPLSNDIKNIFSNCGLQISA